MIHTIQSVKRIYYSLTLFSTLAASFIWGINTLFLLDAGLTNTQAFAANAFFTLGQVLFEVPTGIVADTKGRKISYALGVATLLVTTLAYYWLWHIHGPFWAWAIVSALLGLGFTFFSGATEAWLVDALHFVRFEGKLETVFGKAQSIGGVAMLIGAVSGGFIAQYSNVGVPYIIRAAILGITFFLSLFFMKDLGFKPKQNQHALLLMKDTLHASVENGFKNPPVRWIMIAAPFISGIGFYMFYAMQPYLVDLYGNSQLYSIAGIAAAVIALAQIFGGYGVGFVIKLIKTRTLAMIIITIISAILIALLGINHNFWTAIGLLILWGLTSALIEPIKQAHLNMYIKSEQRATVLSFASLFGSTGGVISQPILGKVADIQGYGPSFIIAGIIQLGAIPFLLLAKKNTPEEITDEVSRG